MLVAVLLGMADVAEAQNGFNIPFSQFGIGQSDMPFGMPMAYRMGGVVSTRASRNVVNPFNPASYSAVEMESFVFDMGVNLQTCVLSNGENNQRDADGNVAYLAVAFPLTKWWKASAGVLPYSSVNYESVLTAADPLTASDVKTIYAGTGGVTQLYVGNAFALGKRLSLGFNVNYLCGNIQRAITYDFQGSDTTYCVNSRRQKDTYVSNMVLDFGLQYVQPLNSHYTMHFGATCRTPRSMGVQDKSLVYTFYRKGSQEYMLDTIFPTQGVSDSYRSLLEQPLQIGAGLSLERNERWEVALDAAWSPYSGIKYEESPELDYAIFGKSSLCYVDNYRVALGFDWKGNMGSSSYWKRIGISGGVSYNRGKLAVAVGEDEHVLNELGLGLGFALPVRKGKSLLSISMAYTSFGDVDLLRRDVFTLGLSISSCERWFQKKRYD